VAAIRQALHLLGRENRGRWTLLIFVALFASLLEVVGAALIFVLLGLVADPGSAIELPALGDVRALVPLAGDQLLLTVAGVMAVFFIVRAVVHVGEIYLQNRIGHNAGAALATKLVRGYLSMPYGFHLTRTSSDLIRNSHQAVKELVGQLFIPMIRVVAETIMVVGMLVLLVTLAPAATGLAVLVIGGAALLMLRLIQPRLKRIGRRAHLLQRETFATLQQSLHGIRDIKVLGQEAAFAARYGRARGQLARVSYLRSTASELPKTVMELALLGFILLVFASAVAFGEGTSGSLSVLGLFAYAGLRLQPSLQKIIAGLNNLKYATAPLEDLSADLDLIEHQPPRLEVPPAMVFGDRIELRDVAFRYDGGHRDALADINLIVQRGEVLGICGPTGGGKTTLVDVLTGLLAPTSGTVQVDGISIEGRERGWQSHLGVVPQMVFLTDESLRANIALGLRREEIDEEAVAEAVELAQLVEFVDSLPDGLDTVVGERGVRVSGGQRQRIAIARALYRRPSVLVFDEGTSALDNITERELMTALARLRGDHTILLIAHRLTTVRDADQIVFLESGRITASGTYDDLMERSDAFRALAAG
jgi:ATP-binding cassette, subfamily B, bacterial PglK